MALVIDLKPNEQILIGNTVITNDKQRTRLRIEGDAPVLREKDTMKEADATTPSKKLYYIIQGIHLSPSDKAMDNFDSYFRQLRTIKEMAPHVSDFLNQVSSQILQGAYYKALKLVQNLMNSEETGDAPHSINSSQSSEFNPANMESKMLSQAAKQLQEIYDTWDKQDEKEIESVVSYNRKLWMVFFDDINDPQDSPKMKNDDSFNIQSNIINLYNYIYKRSVDIINSKDKEKLIALIDINRESAQALLN